MCILPILTQSEKKKSYYIFWGGLPVLCLGTAVGTFILRAVVDLFFLNDYQTFEEVSKTVSLLLF